MYRRIMRWILLRVAGQDIDADPEEGAAMLRAIIAEISGSSD